MKIIMLMTQIIELGKREGKHAQDKSPHAEAFPHLKKKNKRKKKKGGREFTALVIGTQV